MAWIAAFWAKLVNLASVALPFARSGAARQVPPAVRWGLHLLALALILVCLYFLNSAFRIHELIPNPRWARAIWLPLFFLLIYTAGWLTWAIWRLATAGPGDADFPDLDAAWEDARRALDRAGIRLTETPLFLLLGRPETPEEHLFQAAGLNLTVRQTPSGLAPLHVYASRDAIYVTCAGASLLGKHAANLALEGMHEQDADAGRLIGAEFDAEKTIVSSEKESRAMQRVAMPGRAGPLRSLEKRAMRRAIGMKTPNLLQRTEEVERLSGALAHLAALLKRDRHPECPLNGILLLLPLGATDTDTDAQLTAEIVQRDLATLRAVTQLHCPLFALVCDLEAAPGFRDFIDRQANKGGRIGQRFPLESPDLQGQALLDTLERSVQGYCQRGLRDLVYPLFDVPADGTQRGDGLNRNLYLLLDEVRLRKDHLGRLLTNSLRQLADGPLLFGGYYLAATGADEPNQAFVKGVFQRLVESQSYVAWTDTALEQDDHQRRLVGIGYAGVGLLVAAVAALGITRYLSRRP